MIGIVAKNAIKHRPYSGISEHSKRQINPTIQLGDTIDNDEHL